MYHAFSWEWSDCADSSIRGNQPVLATWLHRIVVNAALMKLRTRRRTPEASLDELMPRFDDVGCRIEPRGTTTNLWTSSWRDARRGNEFEKLSGTSRKTTVTF